MTSGVEAGLRMGRSVGVTVSAVVVFVGSAFTLLCGAALVVGSLATLHSRARGAAANITLVLAVEAVFFFGFGGWGVASGVGLIKTKEWSRISLLIYAGMLVFFSVIGAAMMAVVPFPADMASDPDLPANFMVMMRVGFVLFFAVFAALGGFWIYFFNTRDVKAQFVGILPPAMGYTATGGYAEIPGGGVVAVSRKRPLSISIIAWYLLIASTMTLPFWFFSKARYPDVKMPMWFLGFSLYGRVATAYFVTFTAVQIAGAIGLLRLKMWGLYTAIGAQWLGALNIVLLLVIPANRAKLAALSEAIRNSTNAQMHQQVPFSFPAWIGMAASLPVMVLILWFLITGREAFVAAQKSG